MVRKVRVTAAQKLNRGGNRKRHGGESEGRRQWEKPPATFLTAFSLRPLPHRFLFRPRFRFRGAESLLNASPKKKHTKKPDSCADCAPRWQTRLVRVPIKQSVFRSRRSGGHHTEKGIKWQIHDKKKPDVVFCSVSYFEQELVTRVTGYGLGFEAAEYQRKKLTAKPWTNVLLVVNVWSLAERDLVS